MTTETNPATVAAAGENPEEEKQRKADLVLAKTADSRLLEVMKPEARIGLVVGGVVLIFVGVALRAGAHANGWQIAAGWVIVSAITWALPALTYRGSRKEPQWARAAEVHRQSLKGRVPDATLAAVQRCIDTLPRRHVHSSHLYVSSCTAEEAAHFEPCWGAGTFLMKGRLLVFLGAHLTEDPEAAAAALGHESQHVKGWRMRLWNQTQAAWLAGWITLGWALRLPLLLAAAAGLQIALGAVSWMIELSCDAAGARSAGTQAMIRTLEVIGQAATAARATRPVWQRCVASTLTWIAMPTHPPLPVRRAVLRTLARPAP